MNEQYDKLLNEFQYEDYLWCDWTNLETLKFIEDDFNFHKDDILLVSYPKCGNTLISEMLWLLKTSLLTGNIDQTFKEALSEKLYVRVPFLEVTNMKFKFEGFTVEVQPLEYLKKPRTKGEIIKTHLPWSILKKSFTRHSRNGQVVPKIVFVTRNPKDALVSMDNFYRLCEELGPYKKSFNDFFSMWIEGHIVNGDYRQFHLDWFRGLGQLKPTSYQIFYYEDCVESPLNVLQHLKSFLFEDKSLQEGQEQELYDRIIQHTRFSQMKKNKMVNYEDVEMMVEGVSFMRKGIVRDWPNHFSDKQNAIFNENYQQFFSLTRAVGFSDYAERISTYIL